ncbi:MAG: OsmC family protein [Gammaproteobacteria bacterium]|nr:OsmC family protein [Gammaproteobacteria bacterium]
MKGRVKWVENAMFLAQSESGHAVVMDGPPEAGGLNLGLRPMEMVLLGAGGCSVFDVVSILKKSRQPITNCEVELSADRAETVPKVFTKINMNFIVTAKSGVKEAQVARAVKLSAEKYCSASIMLAHSVEITHSYEIRLEKDND